MDWNAHPEFRGDPVTRIHSGPYWMEAFADSVAALMKHLTRTKSYTCARWLCINNEPGYDWSWWQAPPNQPMSLLHSYYARFDWAPTEGYPLEAAEKRLAA